MVPWNPPYTIFFREGYTNGGEYIYRLSGTYYGIIDEAYAPKVAFKKIYAALSGQ